MRPTIVLLAVLLLNVQVLARGADAPNVSLVLSDDVGISRVGCYGAAPFRTPNLDALSATGVRFERCDSIPLCGPSRGVLLTGKHPFHTGYLGNNSSAIDPRRHPTMANVLRDSGYATCAVGTLGQSAAEKDVQAPRTLGFEESMLWMGRNTSDRYWSPRSCRNGEFVQGTADDYGPGVTHEFLVDVIRRFPPRPTPSSVRSKGRASSAFASR